MCDAVPFLPAAGAAVVARCAPAAPARRHSGGGAAGGGRQPGGSAGSRRSGRLPAPTVAAARGARVAVSRRRRCSVPVRLAQFFEGSLCCSLLRVQTVVFILRSPLLCRAGVCATALPRLMQNLASRHTASALEQEGYQQEADALRAATKLCRKAAAAAASAAEASRSGGALAALASVARQRADFWRAARQPWKVRGACGRGIEELLCH